MATNLGPAAARVENDEVELAAVLSDRACRDVAR
jgi:hypothetical protein